MTISQLNSLPPFGFIQALSGIFEHSAWIAVEAETQRPFSDRETLHAAMVKIVADAHPERQLILIRAHPDLAGRLSQQGLLTAESIHEQQSAGLTEADAETLSRLGELNAAYRRKFDFPFIICARLNKVDTILSAMEERLDSTKDREISVALGEIAKIARLRLADLIPS